MEIDFLGLNSRHPIHNKLELQNSKNEFTDSGDEISLSLGTTISNSTFCHKWKNAPLEQTLVPRVPFLYHYSQYGLSHNPSVNLRNASEITATSSTYSSLYPSSANGSNDTLQKADNKIFMAGEAFTTPFSDAQKCTRGGYTPTIAMARKATLARFLKKRSHRLAQEREPILLGRQLNIINSEACNINTMSCNKKKKKSTIS